MSGKGWCLNKKDQNRQRDHGKEKISGKWGIETDRVVQIAADERSRESNNPAERRKPPNEDGLPVDWGEGNRHPPARV